MKKIFSLLIIFSALAISVNAQANSDASLQNKKGMKHNKKMLKDLDLTKQQKKELKQIRKPAKQEKEAIQNDATLTPQQKQEKLKQFRMGQMQKLNTVLTPEQKEKLKTEMKQNNPRRGVTNMPNERTSQ